MADPRPRLEAALAGRYAIERQLGRGGMSRVYLARELMADRPVALKVLHPDLATGNAARFAREIRLAARLSHPNILPVLASGDDAGLLWYAMPFVAGETLRTRLERESWLPLPDVLAIARQVGAALDCAHGQQIVHRDIKPENILLDDGRALVADFGVARALGPDATRITATGMTVGTPVYMSPEQALAEREIDGRADLYSLGCVIYEAIAGRPPFHGTSPRAVLTQSLRDPVPAVHGIRAEVPPAVQRVLARMLAKDPDERFASGAAFSTALERAFAPPGRGDTAEMPTDGNTAELPTNGHTAELPAPRQQGQRSALARARSSLAGWIRSIGSGPNPRP